VKLKGFDKEEVDSFLNLVREQLEELIKENTLLKEESSRREKELTEYKEIESDLKNTLMGTKSIKITLIRKLKFIRKRLNYRQTEQ
jgi:cell division initiation protein